MKKFAEKTIDISDDVSLRMLPSLLSSGPSATEESMPLPEALKNLSILTPDELGLLPDNDFALIFVEKGGDIHRKFPIPDADNAIVSALYLKKTFTQLPDQAAAMAAKNIMTVLDSPAFKYSSQIKDAIARPLYMIKDMYKTKGNIFRETKDTWESELRKGQGDEKKKEAALKDDDFVFVNVKEGQKHRLFPIYDEASLKKASTYFDDNHNLFHLEHRNQFAKKLRDKAAALKVTIKGDVATKYASSEWSPIVELALKNRIEALKDFRYEKTGAEVSTYIAGGETAVGAMIGYKQLMSSVGNTDIDKFASLMHKLDKACGLDKRYGKSITDPYASTYKMADLLGPVKIPEASVSFAGKTISTKDLAKLDIGDLGGMIDDSTFGELKVDPVAVFNSLPIPYKSVILEAIQRKK